MQNINVEFPNADGQQLAGILSLPEGPPRAYVLFAHCFTCGKNLKAATHISRALTAAGLAVLRFDFTGLGQSEGAFEATTFSSNVGDLVAASQFLRLEHEAPAILLGHSLGGTAVLRAAADIPSAKAIATIGAPADPVHVAHLLADPHEALAEQGLAEVSLGGRSFTIKRQFLDDLYAHDMATAVGGLRRALLILHAPLDETVELENAAALFEAAKHPKSFVSLDKADHLLSRSEDARYAGQLLAAWATRYLPTEDANDSLAANEGEVVARTDVEGYRTDIRVGRHALIADEPPAVGGTDLGPTPYGLLSAALASCTTMTLKMYARLKQIDLRTMTVRVSHNKIHADDCTDCDTRDGKIDEFRREISFGGDLTGAQRQRLLEIADKCPVHRTLHSEVKIRTTEVHDSAAVDV